MLKEFLICCLLLPLISGCGEETNEIEPVKSEENYLSPPPELFSIQPSDGNEIAANGKLKITFKRSARSIAINGQRGTAEYGKESGGRIGFGREIIIVKSGTVVFKPKGLVPGQAASFAITWRNQNGLNFKHTLTLNVTDFDHDPPKIIGGNVVDGATAIDPEPLNAEGIWLEYSEPITGNVNLFIGKDGKWELGWIPMTEGNRTIIHPTKAKELGNGTTYKIQGTVEDNACNTTAVEIVFTTCGHPYLVESRRIESQWMYFDFAFRHGQIEKTPQLWTRMPSDFILFHTDDNRRIEARGAAEVQQALKRLAKENVERSQIDAIYVRERDGRLQGSLSASDGLRGGRAWAYFEKIGDRWLINKVESVDPGIQGEHPQSEIHETHLGEGKGYFDDPQFRVECR
jgi:hypothetical protein